MLYLKVIACCIYIKHDFLEFELLFIFLNMEIICSIIEFFKIRKCMKRKKKCIMIQQSEILISSFTFLSKEHGRVSLTVFLSVLAFKSQNYKDENAISILKIFCYIEFLIYFQCQLLDIIYKIFY